MSIRDYGQIEFEDTTLNKTISDVLNRDNLRLLRFFISAIVKLAFTIKEKRRAHYQTSNQTTHRMPNHSKLNRLYNHT